MKSRAYAYVGGPLDGCIAPQNDRKGETVYRDADGTPKPTYWGDARRSRRYRGKSRPTDGYYAKTVSATSRRGLGEYTWREPRVDGQISTTGKAAALMKWFDEHGWS